ncbi:MAG: TrkA-N domain, partial [Actinomycetota bacterium]
MRIAIAGAGQVGRSIARELAANGHSILLLDRDSSVHKIAGENIE